MRESTIHEQETELYEKSSILQENKTALLNYIDEIKHFSDNQGVGSESMNDTLT